MMSKERKIEVAKSCTGDKLLELYDVYSRTFNPIDADKCETFEVIRAEILRRLG